MKTLPVLAAFFILGGTYAQKTDKVKVKYEFDMYPMETISKDKTTDVNVSMNYVERVDAANAAVAAKQEEARLAKEEYDKKSMGQKLVDKKLLGESKPTGVYVNTEYIPTLFAASELESQINMPGFSKKDDSNCKVNASFSELDFTVNQTRTAVSYKPLQVNLKVVNDKGETVYQGDLPNNSTSITYTPTGNYNLGSNYISTIQSLEVKAKNEAIVNLNKYLKTNYGYNVVKDDCPFFDVKDKKHQYPEYHEAIQKLETAFTQVNVPEREDKFVSSLKECITIWETNLKQLDKNDKNARINKDVAAATTLNLALAYTWTKDFNKAYDYLAEHKTLDEDYSRAYDDISKFLKDFSARYTKYSKY